MAGNLAPVVAVLNMKGGVGKTTISAHVFRMLFQQLRVSTLLLDMDPQFNLSQALFKRQAYDKLKQNGKTILSAMEPGPAGGLFEVKASSAPPPPAADIGVVLWHFLKLNPVKTLTIVPGDFRLVKYSLMDDNQKLLAVRKRFLQFVAESRKAFDVVCIDCNPSSSFLTLCALYACTHLLVPVKPDRYSVLGLELLTDFVGNIPGIHPKPETIVLLNGVPRQSYKPTVENELRAHPVFGACTLANKIYESKILVASPDYTGFATDKPVPYRDLLKGQISLVVDELATKLGLTP